MGYRITHPTYRTSKVILLVREVSLIGYVSEVTGLKCLDMLFPVWVQYVQKSLPQVNQSKIIIRRLDMNRIQRIQTFLEDYKSLNPYLKNLVKDSQKNYQKELLNEYLKVSRHHYKNEYLDIT